MEILEEYLDVDGDDATRKAISIRSGGEEVFCVDALLYAGQNVPNTKWLNLDNAHVTTIRGGYVETKENYKTLASDGSKHGHNISAAGHNDTIVNTVSECQSQTDIEWQTELLTWLQVTVRRVA